MTGLPSVDAGAARADTGLAHLLRQLEPRLNLGVFAYVAVSGDALPHALTPIASFREAEGWSVIVDEAAARAAGLPVLFRAAWITLTVASDLQAVGLTAAVSARLSAAGIACNVVAAARHDHLFVPFDDAGRALAVLHALQRDAAQAPPPEPAGAAVIDPLREALDRMADSFIVLDRADCILYANRSALRMLGRQEAEDLIGRHLWTEFPRTAGTPFQRACREAALTGRMMSDEDRLSNESVWWESRIYPSPQGLSIYFSDITPRKRAEEALRRSELRYRLAAVHGQVWDWDLVSGEVEFPLAFWLQLGWPTPLPDRTVSRLIELMHPDDVPRWREALRGHVRDDRPYQLDFRLRAADGRWRWFQTQGLAARDADGRAVYMAGTTFDITRRAQATEALREAETYRRQVFEQLADAVLLIDLDDAGRVLDANPQALQMLGYPRDELLAMGLPALLADHDRGRYDESAAELRDGQPHRGSWDHQRKDGSRFPAEVSARLMDHHRVVVVIRDMTVRRESERVLMAIELELSALAQRLLSQERATTRRIAQGLHDHLGQTLAVARLQLDGALAAQVSGAPPALRDALGQVSALLDQAVREARQVLADLRPPLLEEQGLAVALSDEIEQRGAALGGADVLLELADGLADQRWPDDVEYCALMVAREAVANAQQHAEASLVRVVLEGHAGSLSLDVIDDGKGIPAPMLRGRAGHLGIVGMRERAIAIGAQFLVAREPDGGTRIALRWEAPAA